MNPPSSSSSSMASSQAREESDVSDIIYDESYDPDQDEWTVRDASEREISPGRKSPGTRLSPPVVCTGSSGGWKDHLQLSCDLDDFEPSRTSTKSRKKKKIYASPFSSREDLPDSHHHSSDEDTSPTSLSSDGLRKKPRRGERKKKRKKKQGSEKRKRSDEEPNLSSTKEDPQALFDSTTGEYTLNYEPRMDPQLPALQKASSQQSKLEASQNTQHPPMFVEVSASHLRNSYSFDTIPGWEKKRQNTKETKEGSESKEKQSNRSMRNPFSSKGRKSASSKSRCQDQEVEVKENRKRESGESGGVSSGVSSSGVSSSGVSSSGEGSSDSLMGLKGPPRVLQNQISQSEDSKRSSFDSPSVVKRLTFANEVILFQSPQSNGSPARDYQPEEEGEIVKENEFTMWTLSSASESSSHPIWPFPDHPMPNQKSLPSLRDNQTHQLSKEDNGETDDSRLLNSHQSEIENFPTEEFSPETPCMPGLLKPKKGSALKSREFAHKSALLPSSSQNPSPSLPTNTQSFVVSSSSSPLPTRKSRSHSHSSSPQTPPPSPFSALNSTSLLSTPSPVSSFQPSNPSPSPALLLSPPASLSLSFPSPEMSTPSPFLSPTSFFSHTPSPKTVQKAPFRKESDLEDLKKPHSKLKGKQLIEKENPFLAEFHVCHAICLDLIRIYVCSSLFLLFLKRKLTLTQFL